VRLDGAVVGLGAATGVGMGLLTSLVGLPPSVEPAVWMGGYASWLVVVHRRRSPSPFGTVVVASLASGVAVAVTQSALLSRYVAANPWYAEYMSGTSASLVGQLMVQGVGMGALFGVAVGLLARGLEGRRQRADGQAGR